MKTLSTFLGIVVLAAGMVGCVGGDGSNGDRSYTLIVDFTAGGTVTVDDVPIPGKAILTYDPGTVVRLNAAPSAGYQFAEWTGNVSAIANVSAASTTIAMNGNYSVVANFEQEEVVTFPDPDLEAAIRHDINKPTGPVYYSDLQGLTHCLSGIWMNIANLTGLERCTNLEYLHLQNNQISDISPLANLIHLISLRLGWNQISDISPLANLISLQILGLDSNQIIDISSLANLTNLKNLYLASNQISNIAALSSLSNLEDLDLSSNQINDISSLTDLTNLKNLYLDSNQISDIASLVQNAGLGTGDYVNLGRNPLTSDSKNIYIPQLQARGVSVHY